MGRNPRMLLMTPPSPDIRLLLALQRQVVVRLVGDCWSCHPNNSCSFVSPDKPAQSLLQLKGIPWYSEDNKKHKHQKVALWYQIKSLGHFCSHKCNLQRNQKGEALCSCWSFPFVFSLSTKLSVLPCPSGREERNGKQHCHNSPFSCLDCGVYFFLNNQFFYWLSENIRYFTKDKTHFSFSVLQTSVIPTGIKLLETESWMVTKATVVDLLVLHVVFNSLISWMQSYNFGLYDIDHTSQIYIFLSSLAKYRKISEGKGILKPLLPELAAVHSFPRKLSSSFKITCVCTQSCLES